MRAIVMDGPVGTLESVRSQDREAPRPGPGQVLVRMRLSPVNPSDLNYVHGAYAHYLEDLAWNGAGPRSFDPEGKRVHPTPPFVLGGEGLGIVEASGGGLVARRLVGKRIALTGSPTGLWQEHVVVDAKRAIVLPEEIPDEQGAMFFVNPLTAVALVEHVLALPRGSFLLQTAAGSSLAAIVREIARDRGITTIDVVRRPEAAAELRKRGVVHAISTAETDVLAEVRALTRGHGVDGALDCVGGESAAMALRSLARYGKLVVFGTLGKVPMPFEPRALMMRGATITGFFLPHWIDARSPLVLLRALGRVKALLASGRVRTKVRETFSMEEFRPALESASRGGEGKVMLRIGAP